MSVGHGCTYDIGYIHSPHAFRPIVCNCNTIYRNRKKDTFVSSTMRPSSLALDMGFLDFATIQENMTCAIGKTLYFWSPYVLKLRHSAVKVSKLQSNLHTKSVPYSFFRVFSKQQKKLYTCL